MYCAKDSQVHTHGPVEGGVACCISGIYFATLIYQEFQSFFFDVVRSQMDAVLATCSNFFNICTLE